MSQREVFCKKTKDYPWFEQAIYTIEKDKNTARVKIHDSQGAAHLDIFRKDDRFIYFYRPLSSNPLQVPLRLIRKLVSDEKSFQYLKKTNFPDSFFRIAQAVFEDESEFPDMILSIKGDHRIRGGLDSFTKIFRTHGSLHKDASNGIVASNSDRNLPSYIRTDDILQTFKLGQSNCLKN